MKTFFNYFGGKWRIAPMYPAPEHDVIIEPFAGAAGYSVRHYKHTVKLYDKDPTIVALWSWLIGASHADVMRLPVIGEFETVKEIDAPAGAKALIGFCVNAGTAAPCNTPSKWAVSKPFGGAFWSPKRRERVAAQVELIKHWTVGLVDSYADIPNQDATWFIDPPYNGKQGGHYKHGSKTIDYVHLGEWCKSRQGQAIACEGNESDWLPFTHLVDAKATPKHGARKSRECIWTNAVGGRDGV